MGGKFPLSIDWLWYLFFAQWLYVKGTHFQQGQKSDESDMGLTNQTIDCVPEIRQPNEDGLEGETLDPPSLSLFFSVTCCSAWVSLSLCGNHEDSFCPKGYSPPEETADCCCATLGLLFPGLGWVFVCVCVCTYMLAFVCVPCVCHGSGVFKRSPYSRFQCHVLALA